LCLIFTLETLLTSKKPKGKRDESKFLTNLCAPWTQGGHMSPCWEQKSSQHTPRKGVPYQRQRKSLLSAGSCNNRHFPHPIFPSLKPSSGLPLYLEYRRPQQPFMGRPLSGLLFHWPVSTPAMLACWSFPDRCQGHPAPGSFHVLFPLPGMFAHFPFP
jgi:hypothetical protein